MSRHTFIGAEAPLQSIARLVETPGSSYSVTTGAGF